MMKNSDIIKKVRAALKPHGELRLVKLGLRPASYFTMEFIEDCIDEMEKLPLTTAMGEQVSGLKMLGCILLMDSAYIEGE